MKSLQKGGMGQSFYEAEVQKALAQIIEPGAVFEVRALDAKLPGSYRSGTIAGYFNSVDRCVAELRKVGGAKGVYITINPVNPALLQDVKTGSTTRAKIPRPRIITSSGDDGCCLMWTQTGPRESARQTRRNMLRTRKRRKSMTTSKLAVGRRLW
jgi:hypothetical protein